MVAGANIIHTELVSVAVLNPASYPGHHSGFFQTPKLRRGLAVMLHTVYVYQYIESPSSSDDLASSAVQAMSAGVRRPGERARKAAFTSLVI